MAVVTIIEGNRNLRHFLKNASAVVVSGGAYIAYRQSLKEGSQLLREKGFKEASSEKNFSEGSFREQFAREYVDLIGQAGQNCDNIKWWATTISSKERFTSGLSGMLEEFLFITEIIKEKRFEQLVILNPSWVIIPSLRSFIAGLSIRQIYLLTPLNKWKEIIYFYFRRLAGIFYHSIRVFFRAIYCRRKLSKRLKVYLNSNSGSYVLKNFIYDHSFGKDGFYKDVFFGTLPQFLREDKNLLVYTCILGNYRNCINRIKDNKEFYIAPVEYFISLKDIFSAAGRLIWGKVSIKNEAYFFGSDVKAILNNELVRTFNGIQLYQFLHYWSMSNLLRYTNIKTFVLTYENKSWERMCILALREKSPATKIVGYQHTVVPQASANMFVSAHEKSRGLVPDKIFTVGDATRLIMQKYGSYDGNIIETACGLRFDYLSRVSLLERKNISNILLAVEGIFEVYKVVNYLMCQLKDNKHYKVVIRTHPVLPLNAFKHKLKYDVGSLGNFSLSQGVSLLEDIKRTDLVVYWGSSVALEALAMGRPVVHFDNGSVLSYDPLFECEYLKWKVCEEDNFLALLEKIDSLSEQDFISQRTKAGEYIRKYFYPVREDCLRQFAAV